MRNPILRRGRADLAYSSTDAKSGRTVHVTAAAQILQGPKIKRTGSRAQKKGSSVGWQSDVWELYDLIGELWYGVNWLGNAAGRSKLVAARLPMGASQPVPVTEGTAAELIADFAGGPAGQSQFLNRAGVHLSAVGDSYFVGRTIVEDEDEYDAAPQPAPGPGGPARGLSPIGAPTGEQPVDDEPAEVEWCAYSTDEVSYDSDTWKINDGADVFELGENDVIIRCWRPHPRQRYEAQSPVRPALPVLRELRGLTMHVAAQIESRLAGAGILFVPNNMTFPKGQGPGQAGDATDGEDPFVRDLLDAMLTPLRDRDSAAAVVPLVVEIPPDAIGKIQYVTFATPLDEKAKDLRDEALRRFALGMDMPPEIILGQGDSNHWSSWQVDESSIKLHVEPLLATICLALTVGWLRPALTAAGVPDAREWLVWYDTTDLEQRPDRSQDAKDLHDRLAISDAALRRETGFGEEDAPTPAELVRMILLQVAKQGGDLTVLLRALGVSPENIAAITTGQPAAAPAPDEPAPAEDTSGRAIPAEAGA